MPLVYATTADYEAYVAPDPAPDGVARLIAHASGMVRRATRSASYDTTPTGAPSDPDIAEAMRDATCAQVAFWAGLGVDPRVGAAGVAVAPQSSKILTAQVTYGAAKDTADQARVVAAAADSVCSEAYSILYMAGLTEGAPWVP